MSQVGQRERVTQNRVVALFQNQLGYAYYGDWQDRADNSNIEEGCLRHWLQCLGVDEGIQQNLDNQKKLFIRNFFTTMQLVMAGKDSQANSRIPGHI